MRQLALLLLLAIAAGCRKRGPEPAPDYEGARTRSERSHQDLDRQSK